LAAPVVDILMYHSVSDAGGPTCIAPATFAMQMRAIADAGVPVVTLDDLLAARGGRAPLSPRSVIITFDDGFQDFADAAWPAMQRHGFRPIIYIPTGWVGRAEGWRGIADPPRRLMSWATIRALADDGVDFGSHTVSHADMPALADAALDQELTRSREAITDHLGREVRHFAPPYGRTDARVRSRIARHYATSVGTALASAAQTSPTDNLPRIEMFYFTDDRRWRAHLAGQGAAYLARRRTLRAVRGAVMKPWTGV
jgi:peptidoglycan/xylan/chitin deacetylase (PgdA/CDA1 family)